MKSSIFKYIFILVIIVAISYSVYAIYFKEKQEEPESVEAQLEEIETQKDLRLAVSNFDNINPLISNNKEVLNVDRLIFEPLINITSDYKLEYCLATECSKISDTSYVIKVDNEKKWHNGTPLIAKDVQFTIDRLKEGNSVYAYNVEKVGGIEVIDSTTVRIDLVEPVPFFEYNLTFPILPSTYYLSDDFYNSTKTPIGTGMYKIVSMDGDSIILGKNDKWWNIGNQNTKIEAISIKIFAEIGEVYNSFKLGNIDFFTTTNNNLEDYIGTIGYNKHEFGGREFDYLAFNCENDILKRTEVRKAISYALDKTNIVGSIYNNKKMISSFPLDYGNCLYNSNLIDLGFNQDQAKRTLIDNGWEYKYNRWQKTENYKTKRINLTLTVNRDDAERLRVAENIKGQLEKIGMKITLNKVSGSNYESILKNKNYEMIITGVYNSYSPNIETFFGGNNLSNYKNDEINNILNDVKNINDLGVLKEKYDRILQIYNDEMPFIGLNRNKVTVVRNQDLAGEINPNNFFSYYNIHTWSRR